MTPETAIRPGLTGWGRIRRRSPRPMKKTIITRPMIWLWAAPLTELSLATARLGLLQLEPPQEFPAGSARSSAGTNRLTTSAATASKVLPRRSGARVFTSPLLASSPDR